MRYFLVAGEASGDLHASNLIKSIRKIDSHAQFAFMGGDLMEKASEQKTVVHYNTVAYMGLMPVLLHLKEINQAGACVKREIKRFNPDIVIPVDYAGFNFKYILPFVHDKLNIPIYYYISPKLWAWKRWRVKSLVKYVDKLLCIMPFEQEFYRNYDLDVEYVGNPCVDAIESYKDNRMEDEQLFQMKPYIALLSGSRKEEVRRNLPYMLRAANSYPDYNCVIAGAPGLTIEDYLPYLNEYPDTKIIFGKTYNILEQSTAALVTSGTATLETALIGTPQVVCYKMSGLKLFNWGFKNFFPIKYFSLVNLITNNKVVEELLSADLTDKALMQELGAILPGGNKREQVIEGYKKLCNILGTSDTSDRAAHVIIDSLVTVESKPQ